MAKKRIYLFALISIILSGLPITSPAQQQEEVNLATTPNANIVDLVIGLGEIKVGTVMNCPPFVFKDEEGKTVGFNVDIANALAEALGVKLEIVKVKSDEPAEGFADCHVIIANIPRTLELVKSLSFTEPFFQSGQVAIVSERNYSVKTYSELDTTGRKIGAVIGSMGMQTASKKFNKIVVVNAADERDALELLSKGKIDAFVYDKHFADLICISNPEFKILPEQLSNDFYCLILPRDNPSLSWFNVFVYDFKLSKKYIEIFNKWFGPGKVLH